MKFSIEYFRCVFCGDEKLEIDHDETKCIQCGHRFPKFEGVNFLGSYDTEDTLGLLEVTSKVSRKDQLQTRSALNQSEKDLQNKYENSLNSLTPQTQESVGVAAAGTSKRANEGRLRQWAAFESLSENLDFDGMLCLDLGAGSGADSIRLINRGANVICLDYNPNSISSGSEIVPEALWLGGNSDCLPFLANTFDFTISNAALHHMKDQHQSVKEMYRVTKPGGYVIIVADPTCKSCFSDEEHHDMELRIFNRHPMVMNGVNEGVIPFNRYIAPVEELDSEAKFLTTKIHGDSEFANTLKSWGLDDNSKNYLGGRSTSINTLMKVKDKFLPGPIKKYEEIPTQSLFSYIGDPVNSLNFLLPYLPSDEFNIFPFMKSSKFLLMNGWNTDQDFESDWREGYNRVRLFYTSQYLSKLSQLKISIEGNNPQNKIHMYLSFNGTEMKRFNVLRYEEYVIDLTSINDFNERNLIELGIDDENRNSGALWEPYCVDKTFFVSVL
jgi:SAM-dependent methyltransferase